MENLFSLKKQDQKVIPRHLIVKTNNLSEKKNKVDVLIVDNLATLQENAKNVLYN